MVSLNAYAIRGLNVLSCACKFKYILHFLLCQVQGIMFYAKVLNLVVLSFVLGDRV